jgi:signal peptidase II
MSRFSPGAGRRLSAGLALAALVILLDQWSKRMIVTHWPQSRDMLVPIVPTLDLALNWNRGVSFSLGNNLGDADRFIFVALSLIVSLGLVVWIARGVKPLVLAALGLVIGGALGNCWDRIRVGAVEDFIYFHVGAFHWPVFNLADSAICVGAGLMIFDSLFDRSLSHKNTP